MLALSQWHDAVLVQAQHCGVGSLVDARAATCSVLLCHVL